MLKLSKYKLWLLAGWIGFSSCESLNQAPLDQLDANNFWINEKEVLFAVTGLYNGWEEGTQIFYMDCVSDNSNSDFSWENFQALGNGTASPTNSGNADARFTYVHIRRANWILENIDKAPISDALKNRLKGEVRTIRAYRYLDLAILFGDVPLILSTLTPEDSYVKASSRADVFKFIAEELTASAALLPVKAESGRMSKGAALGFLTRCYAFQNNYAEVAKVSQEIIDLGVYSLFNNYAALFEEANKNNAEVLSDVQYIANTQGYTMLGIMMPNSLGGWSSIVPIQSLVDAYETKAGLPITEDANYNAAQPFKDRDPRFAATIIYPGASYAGKTYDPLDSHKTDHPSVSDNASSTGYNYRKYIQDPRSYANIWNVGTNIIVQRYAEILLLNAEANIEQNKITNEVYQNINLVRARAGMPDVDRTKYNDKTSLQKLVRRELRIELAGEGRRRFDIIRWGIAKDLMNGAVYGSLSKGTVDPTTGEVNFSSLIDRFFVENRSFTEGKNELWPIPQNVIDRSKNTLFQNDNY